MIFRKKKIEIEAERVSKIVLNFQIPVVILCLFRMVNEVEKNSSLINLIYKVSLNFSVKNKNGIRYKKLSSKNYILME